MRQDVSLGQSIVKAVKFLAKVYDDIGAMLKSLDEEMERRGWVPSHNKVSGLLSNSLVPEQWLLPAMYRLYLLRPHGGTGKKGRMAETVAAVVVNLSPETQDEAVCVLAAVRFPKPKSLSEIWDEWDSPEFGSCGTDQLTAFLDGKDGAHSIPDKLLQDDLFPGAEVGIAFTVPLCGLTDTQALHRKVVEPLLEATRKLREE
jgi:hypothetical protein